MATTGAAPLVVVLLSSNARDDTTKQTSADGIALSIVVPSRQTARAEPLGSTPSSQSHQMTVGEFLVIELGLPASNPLCAELPALMDSWPLP